MPTLGTCQRAAEAAGMRLALHLARVAALFGEAPAGACVLAPSRASGSAASKDGDAGRQEAHGGRHDAGAWRVLGVGRSRVRATRDATRLAEIEALRAAARVAGGRDLREAVLVASLEPCELGLAAARSFGAGKLVYGASASGVAAARHYDGPLAVEGGVLAGESRELLGRDAAAGLRPGAAPAMDLTAQALVLTADRTHVLLRRHRGGAYDGRLTGIIEALPGDHAQAPECVPAGFVEAMVDRAMGGLAASGPGIESVSQHGLLEFYELGEGQRAGLENEFVVRLAPGHPAEPGDACGLAAAAGLEWFPRDAIPFEQMPDDDREWYGPVLDLERAAALGMPLLQRLTVTGHFVFDGQQMVCHEVRTGEAGR